MDNKEIDPSEKRQTISLEKIETTLEGKKTFQNAHAIIALSAEDETFYGLFYGHNLLKQAVEENSGPRPFFLLTVLINPDTKHFNRLCQLIEEIKGPGTCEMPQFDINEKSLLEYIDSGALTKKEKFLEEELDIRGMTSGVNSRKQRKHLARASVIVGVVRDTKKPCAVLYGHETLVKIILPHENKDDKLRLVWVLFDPETDELKQLLTMVATLKDYHEYGGGKHTLNKTPTEKFVEVLFDTCADF